MFLETKELIDAAANMRSSCNMLYLSQNPDIDPPPGVTVLSEDEALENYSAAFSRLQGAEYYASKAYALMWPGRTKPMEILL